MKLCETTQTETPCTAVHSLTDTFRDFVKDESGATALEYGLIAACIGMATILGMNALATNQDSAWNALTDKVNTTIG